jgi:hypothetical protein
MTAVGKILVFFNLVFALGVGALTVLNYSARTYWKDGYEDVSKRLAIADAAKKAYEAQNKQHEDYRKAFDAKLQDLIGPDLLKSKDPVEAGTRVADAMKEMFKRNGELEAQLKELAAAKTNSETKLASANTALLVAKEDLNRRQSENEAIRKTLQTETDKNTQLVREKNELRDRATGAVIEANALKQTNKLLEEQLQDQAKVIVKLQANRGGTTVAARGTNPPPENVEGLVKRIDTAGGQLMTISLGSDSGISKGNTLEVFRFGNPSKYVGRIEVVEVRNNQSVAKPSGRLQVPIQVGDHVASQILR